ncbi:unnamed protein product [Arabidopsis halleri]
MAYLPRADKGSSIETRHANLEILPKDILLTIDEN